MKTASEFIDWYDNELEQIFGLKEQLYGTPLGGFVSYFWEESQHAPDFCQCNTETLFEFAKNPIQLRAYMMVSTLIDQMMWTHFSGIYDNFRSVFRYPKISRHAGGGCASPSWVIIYWEKVDWLVIDETANILLSDLYKWIQVGARNKIYKEEPPEQPRYRTRQMLTRALNPTPDRYGRLEPYFSSLVIDPLQKQLNSKSELKLTEGGKFVPSPERATDIVSRFQNILKEEIKIEFREPEAEMLINTVEKYEIVGQ